LHFLVSAASAGVGIEALFFTSSRNRTMLEEEIRELRISIDILTKGLGIAARAIRESSETTDESAKQSATKEDAKHSQPKLTIDEVRAVFTRAAKSGENREKLMEILNTYGGKRLDDIKPDDLPIVKAEAEALAA